ncbi:hypothetical protein PG987_004881 [Apiospora arundinis]
MRISASSLALGLLCSAAPGRTFIDADFESPSNEFRPKFRYWLPDASVPADVVRQDIATIAAVGGGGVEFVPFYFYGLPTGSDPPTDWAKFGFGTPAFKTLLQAALEEAKTQGLRLDVGQGASQGQGVPSDSMSPGLAVELAYGTANVLGGNSFDDLLPPPVAYNFLTGFMHEPEVFGKPKLKAVLAGAVDEISDKPGGPYPMTQIVLNEASVVDLTSQVADSRLSWTAPAGNATWKPIVVYEKYTNQRSCAPALGAADRITDFWDTTLLDTDEMKQLVSDVVKYFWEDSMEMQAALYWTPSLMQQFSKDRGYDLTRYLPLLFDVSNQWNQLMPPYNETWVYGANGSSVKAAVLADYRTTLTEGNQEYLRHFVNWAHTLGVEYSSQPGYNVPVDMSAVVPIVDAPEMESLGFPTEDSMRQFTGPALSAGKPVISNEVGAVRGASYSLTVPELLGLFKTSFAAGVSMEVIHGFGYTGEYPQTTWPGYNSVGYAFTEMWNNKLPAWNHFQDAMDYAARHMLILQRGTPKVDIAGYFYPAPFDLTPVLPTETLTSLGFSYDYLGPENLSPSLDSWNLTVTSYVPASNESTAVAFEHLQRSVRPLKPWTEIEGLASVGGVGEYTTAFDFPYDPNEYGAHISFGPVKDTLRAWVNDQQLPPIDVADARVDIADFVRQGSNTLRVNVTSSLFNAVKARLDTILISGAPLSLVNPVYESAPLAEFGLIGPVILQPVQRLPLNVTVTLVTQQYPS